MRDFSKIEIELRRLEQLKSFAVGLQHAVLDAVVNHLDEMAGAARSDMEKAVLGRKRLKNGFEVGDDFFLAADHHAVADLETPDAAAGAGVNKMQSLLFEFFGAPNRIFIIRIAAVDEDVAFG